MDLLTHDPYPPSRDTLWGDSYWPKGGWAGSIPTSHSPLLTPRTPKGGGLQKKAWGKAGAGRGWGVPGPGAGASIDDFGTGGLEMGIPGYGGIGAWGLGWEDWEDAAEGYVDPPATCQNVMSRTLASHPLRPYFLVGSNNTHIYLWEVRRGGGG